MKYKSSGDRRSRTLSQGQKVLLGEFARLELAGAPAKEIHEGCEYFFRSIGAEATGLGVNILLADSGSLLFQALWALMQQFLSEEKGKKEDRLADMLLDLEAKEKEIEAKRDEIREKIRSAKADIYAEFFCALMATCAMGMAVVAEAVGWEDNDKP